MGLRNIPKYLRNIWIVILISLAGYLILNLVFLDVKIGELIYNLINALFFLFEGQPERISRDLIAIVSDGVICIGGLIFWIFFFGQFVLPTHTLRERVSTPPLITKLITGGRGPAIFIRNGKIHDRPEELERKGAGVILLDSASAAVLIKKGKFSRAVGPGLVFTKKNEKLLPEKHTVDLRLQVRTIGPLKEDGFFFDEIRDREDDKKLGRKDDKKKVKVDDAAKDKENNKKKVKVDPLPYQSKEYNEREDRRMQTSGLTRDGIEIIPNITTIFKLDADPGEGNSQFGYRRDATKKAILYQAIDDTLKTKTNRTVEWEWLPAHLAADLWREYLRKFKLTELFNITEAATDLDDLDSDQDLKSIQSFDKTAFNHITEMVKLRLTQPYVQVMNDVGQLTKQFAISREYELLQNHGIRLIEVVIGNLRLNEEETLIERWNTTWLHQANIQKENNEKRHELRRRKGEEDAAMDFAISAVGQLSRDLDNPLTARPGAATTLRRLLGSTRASLVRNTIMIEKMTEERAHLDDMIEWLGRYQNRNDEE